MQVREMDDFYTLAVAARYLGVTRDGVLKAVKKGALPATLHYGRYLVLKEDLDSYRQTRTLGRPKKPEPQEEAAQ
jgi:excisionase family DNA binding protein